MASSNSNGSYQSFVKAMRDVKDLDPKILAVFLTDSDGLPIHEIGLFDLFSKDGGFQLTAFAAEILAALKGIEGDLTKSPFETILAENEEFKLLLFYLTDYLIFGIVSDREANIGLIRIVVTEQLETIQESLSQLFNL
ncbi:MAG: roadblock/LC7 domain-containing protein [Candidatus Hodarchaeales archaeon]